MSKQFFSALSEKYPLPVKSQKRTLGHLQWAKLVSPPGEIPDVELMRPSMISFQKPALKHIRPVNRVPSVGVRDLS